MDYKTKCTACGEGEGIPVIAADGDFDNEAMHIICCTSCPRSTGPHERMEDATDEWRWLQAITPKVTADCVEEIAAAVPEGKIATGLIAHDPAFMSQLLFTSIEPAPLTGKVWAAKQEPGTMFEIDGCKYLIVGNSEGSRRIVPVVIEGSMQGFCDGNGRWFYWNMKFDAACDAHIIHRPKGGVDQPATIRVELISFPSAYGNPPHIDLTWHSGDQIVSGIASGFTEDIHIDLHIKAADTEGK